MARILMLVINPMTADTRVEKEADSLGRAGHSVTVVGTRTDGLPAEDDRGTFVIRRLPYTRPVKQRLERRERAASARARQERHALGAVLRHPPARMRRTTRLIAYVHLAVVVLRRILARVSWMFGGGVLKTVRSRILPVEYWRGLVARVPETVQRCDVIHAHDLGPLAAAVRLSEHWHATHPHLPRPRVVYDSHEYYVEQNTRWTWFEKRLWALHERRWIRHADAVITVSAGIARALQRRYRLPEVPTVVHNAPPADRVAHPGDVRSDAGLGVDVPLAVYVGGVKPGRGVERLVPALAHRADLHLAILGAGHTSDPHLAAILESARVAGVRERIHVLPAVPSAALTTYLASATVGVHPMEPTCLNHELALPNKLFDYVFAGLPVAVSDLTEMRQFVHGYGVGATFDPLDPVSTATALGSIVDDPERYRPTPAIQSQLRERFGWTTQQERLYAIYARLLMTPRELAA